MRRTLKLISVMFLIVSFMLGFGYHTMEVHADATVPKEGDTFYFAGKDWLIIHIDSGEYFLYAKNWQVGQNGFAHATSSYTGAEGFGTSAPWSYIGPSDGSGVQDNAMNNWYNNNVSATDKNYVKPYNIYAEYYNLRGRSRGESYTYSSSFYARENGNSYTRYMYAISAEEYAKYCQGLSWINDTMNDFRCGNGSILVWTRTGRAVDRGTPNRPVYIGSDGNLDNINVTRPSDTIFYSLVSQKNHDTGGNVSNFSLTSTSGFNLDRAFNIAGSTPAGVYDLTIQVTRNYSPGYISSMIDNGGCFDRVGVYRAALRLDRSKVDPAGVYYSGGKWHIGGGVTPSETVTDSYQSGSKVFSTAAQTQSYVGANRTSKIYYTLTITKAANTLITNASGSGSRTYSTSAGTQNFDASATNAQGAVTYTISSQKDSDKNVVTYFDIPNSSNQQLSVAAGTPAGVYTIVIYVTSAGNNNYNSVTKTFTYTLTVNPADNPVKFDDQSGQVYFRMVEQPSPEVEPAYDNEGLVTYSVVGQKNSSNANVSYFSIGDNTSPNFTIAPQTPVDTYKITLRATAAGNNNYKSGYKDMTYTLTVKQASIPEITLTYYKANPSTVSTTRGVYENNDRTNVKALDYPYVIGVTAQDKPMEPGVPVFGLTRLYYQISTDGGISWSSPRDLYNGAATLDAVYYEIESSQVPSTYYIKVTGVNDVGNTGYLQDLYRIGSEPTISAEEKIFYVGQTYYYDDVKEAATAHDIKDGDLTTNVVVEKIIYSYDNHEESNLDDPSWTLKTDEPTKLVVQFSVENSEGKTATATTIMYIVDPSAPTRPNGNVEIYDRYIDQHFEGTLPNGSIWKDEYSAELMEIISHNHDNPDEAIHTEVVR